MNIKYFTYYPAYYVEYILLVGLIVSIVLFNSYNKREGFVNGNIDNNDWSPDLIRRFNIYQTTVNMNNHQFDLDILQKQASSEEAEHLLATGHWPWPDDLKYLYMDNVWSNPIIKIQPEYALDYAMRIYNENAARQLLAWDTKEGQFLLYGGNLGATEGLHLDNTLKCSVAENGGDSVLEKKVYTGMNLWNGYMNTKTDVVKNEDVPKVMPGFSFVKGACNPCGPLNSEPDFSCPFRLNVEGDDQVSSVWKSLWH